MSFAEAVMDQMEQVARDALNRLRDPNAQPTVLRQGENISERFESRWHDSGYWVHKAKVRTFADGFGLPDGTPWFYTASVHLVPGDDFMLHVPSDRRLLTMTDR